MITAASNSVDNYVLGRSTAETQRLIRQAHLYGPLTRQFLIAAGITAGMKVLDVGSGAGDVALLLAELVGPRGRVIGVDLNPAILDTARARVEAMGWTNVTFLAGDVDSIDLDHDFEAVVGRWLLMHHPNPVAVLRRLTGYLRPGGVLAFQEGDFSYPPTAFPAGPLHQQVVQWTTAPPDRGLGPKMGSHLYQTYLAAGLPEPQLRLEAPIGGGPNWPGYDYVADTVRSLLPMLEQRGRVTAVELDLETLAERLRAEVVGQGGVQMLPIIIGAWTRKP
ncbi:MAG TPA: class I SAM-dependent methyltransferase [Anaerolineae bacterium]|nr:class I SAM-dependent methyltransferase [Anaerolineae bacterium]